MGKREKRLKKGIESLEKEKQEYIEKIEAGGRKDTTRDYWRKEIGKFEEEIKKKRRLLQRKK